jgi:hypothetical protein
MPRTFRVITRIIISLLLGSCGRGSPGWEQLSPETSPPASGLGAAATMDLSGTAVLFGGITLNHWLNETWIWDGKTWQQAILEVSPPAREKHAMAYDPGRDRIVLFGGSMLDTLYDDTWEWDGLAGICWNRSTGRQPAAVTAWLTCASGTSSSGGYDRKNIFMAYLGMGWR